MSAIEWTDATWNPVVGCSMARGSETGGCLNCYAARMATRALWPGEPLARMTPSGPRWTGRVDLRSDRLDAPLRWRKPRRVFVNSMSDLFHEALPFDAVESVFRIMVLAERHTFQVLTKRPERMREFCLNRSRKHSDTVPPNVWLGVSVENQKTADERTPLLLQTPAAKRFVSYEPALGTVDLEAAFSVYDKHGEPSGPRCNKDGSNAVDWVIVGGESGPGARPCDVAWIRSVVCQCREAGVACFVKQLGARPIADWTEWAVLRESGTPVEWSRLRLQHPKGGDPSEWPEDLRVREFPR